MKKLRLKWILLGLFLLIPLSSGQCQINVDSAYVYKCAEWKVRAFIYLEQRDSLNIELTHALEEADRPRAWKYGLAFGVGLITIPLLKLLSR
jgi:hypothetical protein